MPNETTLSTLSSQRTSVDVYNTSKAQDPIPENWLAQKVEERGLYTNTDLLQWVPHASFSFSQNIEGY